MVLDYCFIVKLNIYLMGYEPTMNIPVLWALYSEYPPIEKMRKIPLSQPTTPASTVHGKFSEFGF